MHGSLSQSYIHTMFKIIAAMACFLGRLSLPLFSFIHKKDNQDELNGIIRLIPECNGHFYYQELLSHVS